MNVTTSVTEVAELLDVSDAYVRKHVRRLGGSERINNSGRREYTFDLAEAAARFPMVAKEHPPPCRRVKVLLRCPGCGDKPILSHTVSMEGRGPSKEVLDQPCLLHAMEA